MEVHQALFPFLLSSNTGNAYIKKTKKNRWTNKSNQCCLVEQLIFAGQPFKLVVNNKKQGQWQLVSFGCS